MLPVILVLVTLALAGLVMVLGVEGLGRLKRMYNQGGERHWDLLGQRVGLLHGHDARGAHVLDGVREGVWLHVEAEGAWLIVRGRIEASLPQGFQVSHHSLGSDGLKIGSPVLDGLICVHGEAPTVQLLQDPDLAGALLAVVHAWPGSRVDGRHVTLRYHDTLGRHLEERCQEVIALVCVLRQVRQRRAAGQAQLELVTQD